MRMKAAHEDTELTYLFAAKTIQMKKKGCVPVLSEQLPELRFLCK